MCYLHKWHKICQKTFSYHEERHLGPRTAQEPINDQSCIVVTGTNPFTINKLSAAWTQPKLPPSHPPPNRPQQLEPELGDQSISWTSSTLITFSWQDRCYRKSDLPQVRSHLHQFWSNIKVPFSPAPFPQIVKFAPSTCPAAASWAMPPTRPKAIGTNSSGTFSKWWMPPSWTSSTTSKWYVSNCATFHLRCSFNQRLEVLLCLWVELCGFEHFSILSWCHAMLGKVERVLNLVLAYITTDLGLFVVVFSFIFHLRKFSQLSFLLIWVVILLN